MHMLLCGYRRHIIYKTCFISIYNHNISQKEVLSFILNCATMHTEGIKMQ